MQSWTRLVLQLLLGLLACQQALCQLTPVETDDAIYHGRILSLSGPLQTIGYLGIPYAVPPLGPLRFARPLPWSPSLPGTSPPSGNDTDSGKPEVNATQPGPACMQRPDPSGTPANMSEDCLYLSIQTPTRSAPPDGLPVFVWLHGGYFETGAIRQPADAFAWDLVASQQSLLSVEVAYRLGVFGFLSLTEDVANAGLLDQQLALTWIARNIGFFGGNNASVTLAGLDAGAASVGFHLVSPGSRDLFQRCAFFGGSPLAAWAFARDRTALGAVHREFYQLVGCVDHANSKLTLECLRKLTAEALNEGQTKFNHAIERVEFPAVLDGRFLTTDPLDAFRDGQLSKSALVGATNLEGVQMAYRSLRASNISDRSQLVGQTHQQLLYRMFLYLPRFPEQPSSLVRDFLLTQLTAYESSDTGAANFDLLVRALTQQVTVCTSNRFTDQLVANASSSLVFSYLFAEPDPNAADYQGAGHGRDAAYFVGEPLRRADYDEEQRELSRRMISQLTGFVTWGNVSYTGWLPTGRSSLQFYRFVASRSGAHAPGGMLKGGYERQECRLWDELLPLLRDAERPRTSTTESPGHAEARFWERCNATVNTISLVAIVIGGSLILLLLVCVVLVSRGRRGSTQDSIELYQRVTPVGRHTIK